MLESPAKDVSRSVRVEVKRKPGCEDLPLPSYATEGSSGMDLYADVTGDLLIKSGETRLVSAGIYLSIPKGYEAQIRPRSGLALKHGITLPNTPGTIDSDYRGLLSIILINLGKEDFLIKRGDRIAQMVFNRVAKAELQAVEELDETVRSSGGFGHTGI